MSGFTGGGGFDNPPVGNQGILVRPAIKSPNFVAGVSGWSINRNGQAFFTGLVITGGTIEISGAGSGEFIYDAGGALRSADVGQTTTDPVQGITCYAGKSTFNGHGACISLLSSTLDAQFWYADTGTSTQGALLNVVATKSGVADPVTSVAVNVGFSNIGAALTVVLTTNALEWSVSTGTPYTAAPTVSAGGSGTSTAFVNLQSGRSTAGAATSSIQLNDSTAGPGTPYISLSAGQVEIVAQSGVAVLILDNNASAPGTFAAGAALYSVSNVLSTNGPFAITAAAAGGSVLKITNTTAAPTTPNVSIVNAAAGDPAFGVAVAGDTVPRLVLEITGAGQAQFRWGSGAAGADVFLRRNAAGLLFVGSADFSVGTAGRGLRVAEGSNAKQGTATLVAGTKIVANTSVTASSRIFLTAQDNNSTGALGISARTAGTSFTITSSNAADSGVVAYQIFEPG